jgi:hypothetical protein
MDGLKPRSKLNRGQVNNNYRQGAGRIGEERRSAFVRQRTTAADGCDRLNNPARFDLLRRLVNPLTTKTASRRIGRGASDGLPGLFVALTSG